MRRLCILALVLSALLPALAQSNTPQTGVYEFGSYDTPGFDTINRGNLNTHFSIPIFSKPGRGGTNFTFALNYDGIVWTPTAVSGGGSWQPAPDWGWTTVSNAEFGYVSYTLFLAQCVVHNVKEEQAFYTGFEYHDSRHRSHKFNYTPQTTCGQVSGGFTGSGTYTTTDNSGYTIYRNGSSFTAYDRAGAQYAVSAYASYAGTNGQTSPESTAVGTFTDTNGNTISASSSGVFTDTLGKTVLTVTGSGTTSSPTVYTYPVEGGSSTATVTVNYTNYNVATSFATNSTTEYSATGIPLISSVVYSGDNSKYTFTYEATPGQSGYVTGRIASITLRTGGTITYAYTGSSRAIEDDGSPTALKRTTSDGSTTYVRSGETSTASTTTYTDASSNQAVSNFMEDANGFIYETSRSLYSGSASGTALQAVTTCYSSCSSQSVTSPIGTVISSLARNGTTLSTVTNQYSGGLLSSSSDGYYTTTNTYQSFTGANSINFSRLASVTTTDNQDSNVKIAQTSYSYDQGTPKASGFTQNSAVTTARGNLSSISPWLNTTKATFGATSLVPYDTGDVYTWATPNGTTTVGYDSSSFYPTGLTPPTPSSGVQLSDAITTDANTGLPLTSTDPNGNVTTYKTYDFLLRPTEIDYPDGGKSNPIYISPNQVNLSSFLTASTYETTAALFDGYGRPSRSAAGNGQSGNNYYQQDTCYDTNGRVHFRSHKYAGTGFNESPVCSGAGDTYTYDAIGRVTEIAHADGKATTYSYNRHGTEMTDEKGVQRIVQIDGHGRISAVCEVTSTSLQGQTPVNCGLDITATGFLTTYAYSTNSSTANQVTTVTQGSQTRVFQTDSLGRTVSVQEPEVGTTTYTYAYSTSPVGLTVTRTKPHPDQSGSATTITTTQYDALGRVVSVSYNDGNPTKTFNFDKADTSWSESGQQTNIKGQLSSTFRTTAAGQSRSMYGYDTMGRVKIQYSCLPSGCGTPAYDHGIAYGYDLAGNLTSEGDGAGDTYTYGRSLAGELTSMTNSFSDAQDPAALMSNVVNGPNGPLSYTLGNGLTTVNTYDSLGRRNASWVCNNGSTASDCGGGAQSNQAYGYTVSWTGGYATGVCDTIVNTCDNYGYDGMGRLASKTTTQGAANSYVYSYDRYGNRWAQTPQNGGNTSNVTFNQGNNIIQESGFTNDAAGNTANDSYHSYTYDADGNLTAVDGGSTAKYAYDALNQRTQISPTRGTYEFVFDIYGRRMSTWSASSHALVNANAYSDSAPVAIRTSSATEFEHQNWLGTERLRTSYNGGVLQQFNSLPWGDGLTPNGDNGDQHDFAKLDRDLEDNTEHAGARNYATLIGRWLSPDPYYGSYDFTNPQSFNRYAYALNNPLSLIDPSGLDCTVVEYYDPSTGQDISTCIVSSGPNDPPSCTPVINPQGQYEGCVANTPVESGGGGDQGGSNSGGGAGGDAPSKPGVGTCLAQAASNGRGIALGADLVGDIATGVAIANPASTAAIVIGAAAASVGGFNVIAQNGGLSDLGIAAGNQTVAATGVLTRGLEIGTFIRAGTSFSKALTGFGILGSVVSTVTDANAAISAYTTCRNGKS